MTTVRVDLHCHSTMSDGFFKPEAVADYLARAGVRHASLTDHDTTEGLARFADALADRGIEFFPGVEITATVPDGMVHLLAYGFNPANPHLQELLLIIRLSYLMTPAMMMERARRFWTKVFRRPKPGADSISLPEVLGVREVADVVHQAGGLLFLAHPLVLHPELNELDEALEDLKMQGLDGLEAIYGPYEETVRGDLINLAENHNLLVSFGTDFHGGPVFPTLNSVGIDIPGRYWETFHNALNGERHDSTC